MEKAEIRREIIKKRMSMSTDEVSQLSLKICDRILMSDEYKASDIVLAYMSIRNEVDPGRVINRAVSDGKRVYIPKVYPKRHMEFYLYDGDFSEGSFGIREPKKTDEEMRFDKERMDAENPLDSLHKILILVPGVAFDETGNRLGYGGGYYDTYLSGLRGFCDSAENDVCHVSQNASNNVTAFGLAYSFQVLREIPVGRYDVKLDRVMVE